MPLYLSQPVSASLPICFGAFMSGRSSWPLGPLDYICKMEYSTWARLLLEAPAAAGDDRERLVEGSVGALNLLQDCHLGPLHSHGHFL